MLLYNSIVCVCDRVCSMASTIIQLYLKQVLESFFHSQAQVRMCALSVITLILGQGLVHPVQVSNSCIYLIQTQAITESFMNLDCNVNVYLP